MASPDLGRQSSQLHLFEFWKKLQVLQKGMAMPTVPGQDNLSPEYLIEGMRTERCVPISNPYTKLQYAIPHRREPSFGHSHTTQALGGIEIRGKAYRTMRACGACSTLRSVAESSWSTCKGSKRRARGRPTRFREKDDRPSNLQRNDAGHGRLRLSSRVSVRCLWLH